MIETEVPVGTGMKITVRRDGLVQRLAIVSRAVSTRATVQILSGILLRSAGDDLQLAATDMELSLRTTVPAQIEGDGAVVVPGRRLVELAKLLPSEEVEIEHRPEESVVHVTSGSASYTLQALLETVNRVARSASRDESRPVLTGILARFEAGKFVMAATDSYRLSVKETELGGQVPELEAIIPARALQELTRIAQSGDEVELGVHENQVVFSVDGIAMTTRRIDGQFPNYRQLLPESFEHELALPRNELLDVVRRAAVMIERTSPLQLRFAEGELTVTARTHEVGESKESLPAPFTGDPLEIGFNADFLRDGLESVTGDEVRFKLISPLRPAVLQGESDDFTYLVMPIRLPGAG